MRSSTNRYRLSRKNSLLAAVLAVTAPLLFSCAEPFEEPGTEPEHSDKPLMITAPQTVRIPISADTTVRLHIPHSPAGSEREFQVGRSLLDWNRSLLRVDTQAIRSMVGSGKLVAAKLQFTLKDSIDFSFQGSELGVHPMTKAWTEAGATWSCANDTATWNWWLDCSAANKWSMISNEPYARNPTDTVRLAGNQTGTLEFDVSSDVRSWLSGAANHGWAVRIENDPIAAIATFYSREGNAPPQLVLTFVGPCDAATGACGKVTKWEAPNGDELPTLEDPIPGRETFAMAEAFDWRNTVAVPETNADGYPSLRYALIYIESRDQLKTLDEYQIDWDYLPFFRSERAKWAGKKGLFDFTGDGRGVFVFAFIPAAVYNAIREHSLAFPDEQPYRALVLRDLPAGVGRYSDGSIDYQVLADEGYLYRGIAAEGPTAIQGTSQPLFGRIARIAVTWIVDVGKAAFDGVRTGIGGLSQWARGEAYLNLTFWALNTDPAFDNNDSLRRAWGTNRGSAIALSSMPVRINQGGLGFKLHRGETNENGYARIVVASNQPTETCIDLENDAASISALLSARRACDFSGTFSASEMSGEVTRQIFVDSRDTNIFAQFTDSALWMDKVNGFKMKQARVLVGKIADAVLDIGEGSPASAPCMDFPNWAFSLIMAPLNEAVRSYFIGKAASELKDGLPAVETMAGVLFSPDFLSPDIIMGSKGRLSRGIATHEYGHYVMCNLLFDEGAYDFGKAYTGVILATMLNGGDEEQRGASEVSIVSEAWADFVSSQAAGGTNYFQPFQGPSGAIPTVRSLAMYYCDPRGPQCMDDNLGAELSSSSSDPFDQQLPPINTFRDRLGKVLTIMHDVFDGNPQSSVVDSAPTNGAAWFNDKPVNGERTLNTSQSFWNANSHQHDEQIALPMNLRDVIREWANVPFNSAKRLSFSALYSALSDYMTARGVSDERVCELFALHERTNTCPSYLPVAANITPDAASIRSYLFSTLSGVPDSSGRNGHWEWEADAPFATNFRYELRDFDSNTLLTSGTRPYVRADLQVLDRSNLPYNREFALFVTVENDARRSPTAKSLLATPAEPVVNIFVRTLKPGQTEICWEETEASSYVLEKRLSGGTWEPVHTAVDGPADAISCKTFYSLEDVPHEFRVTANNRHGEPCAPSPVLTVTPVAPVKIHVSSTTGNDAYTNPGSAERPFATIEAALALVRAERSRLIPLPQPCPGCPREIRSDAFDAVRLHIAVGTYQVNSQIKFDGPTFITEFRGGLSPETWAPQKVRSRLALSYGLAPSGACAGASGVAGISVQNGVLVIRGIEADVQSLPPPDTNGEPALTCQLAVSAASAKALTVADSTLAVRGASGNCQMGLAADSTDALMIERSQVLAASSEASARIEGNFFGACAVQTNHVDVVDSQILMTNSSAPSGGSGLNVGLLAFGSTLNVKRSRIEVARYAPNWQATGSQYGMAASAVEIDLSNSVFTTATSGTQNHALSLNGLAGGTQNLYFITAITGSSWAHDVPGPSAPDGASVVELTGETTAFNLYNSVIAYGAGDHARMAGIDRSRLVADPHTSIIRGNVISLWDKPGHASDAEAMRCGIAGPARNTFAEVIDDDARHICVPKSEITSFVIKQNAFAPEGPCDSFACLDDSDGIQSAYSTKAVVFVGAKPFPNTHGLIACTGVRLSTDPRWPTLITDVDGVRRHLDSAGVDDDCDGTIDEPVERSPFSSAGAFHAPCPCEAVEILKVL